MRKPFRRKIKTRTGQKEYDGLIALRLPIYRDIRGETQSAADRRKGAIDARVSKAREWATQVLRNAGLPDTKPAHAMPDDIGDWPDAKIEEYFGTLPPPPVDVEAPTNGRELSLEWHACQILKRIASLEDALANGDPQWLVLAGMELAEAWHHAVFTENYEIYAAMGWAQSQNGRRGRPRTRDEVEGGIWARAQAEWKRNPAQSLHATARAVWRRDDGVSPRTITRILKARIQRKS